MGVITKYKFNNTVSDCFPTFNEGFIYTYTDEVNGAVTTRIIESDGDFASCSFNGKSNLLSVEYLKVTDKVTSMGNMFYGCSNLTSLDLSGFDTSNVSQMGGTFSGCSSLTDLDLSGFNTAKVTLMNNMFNNCSNLTSLDASGFNTSKVTNMAYMFFGCSGLTDLDVTNFNTANVTSMDYMFYNCSSLTSLDVSGFDTAEVTRMGYMFSDCSSLTSLDVSGFNTAKVTAMQYMFSDCSKLKEIGLIYANVDTINDISALAPQATIFIDANLDTSEYTGTAPLKVYKTFTTTITLTTSLKKVGDKADRLYWDDTDKCYYIEQWIDPNTNTPLNTPNKIASAISLPINMKVFENATSVGILNCEPSYMKCTVPYFDIPDDYEYNEADELEYIKQSFELRYPDEDDVPEGWGYMGVGEEGTGLKALIDWVDGCSDEEFVEDFEKHFLKDYTLRYYCLVVLIGAVDNLGKNMMLDTADNKIFFPRFYDIDTICSYDNSGQLKFDVDIEMEQGYWNTSTSRLWTRIRELMHNDIVRTYNDMRQNGVSLERMMHYIYDEQIAKIPQTYYNKDYNVKYAPFTDSYIGMAHGDTYEHVKRWLKQRFAFVDTLFDYAPSYNNDVLTIRANTTELMTLEIETYTPVYQHLSWYNGQMDKKKIDGKVSVEFSGTAQAATDQEVLIYGGSNVKSIKGITSMNPNRMLIGSATKLVEIDAHDCPLLADINANKANLSPHEYLNKVNLSNCPLLEGNLRLNNSPLVQEINIKGTNITGMNLPSSIRNLQVLRLPNTMTDLTLNDANMLHTLEFDEGVNLQSVSMTNCNALENVTGFDLLQTPSITLNNSYNTVAELYFKDTTNLSLSNMTNLERVIYTPNNEYETFELINVANAPDYKVTTFNCPKLSTFITTAPYRESYNDCDEVQETRYIKDYDNLVDILIDKTPLNAIVDTQTGAVSNSTSGIHYTSQNYIEVEGDTEYTINITGEASARLNLAFYNNSLEYIEGVAQTNSWSSYTFTTPSKCCYIRYHIHGSSSLFQTSELLSPSIIEEIVYKKDYGDIQPNTTFTANSIDISNTQFTDVKLLCTTDTNTLKLPITVKNFYCDSSFDLDTDYLEDGEYDVVHGELVEPYTTDYEGEVSIYRAKENSTLSFDDLTWATGGLDHTTGLVSANTYRYTCDEFIPAQGGTDLTTTYEIQTFVEYDENKNFLSGKNWAAGGSVIHLNANTCYVRFSIYNWQTEDDTKQFEIKYTGLQPCTPNLIPSSADGSLIFSMYAPSNTVAPASGIWDLKGLEFDNFHTYGMNNDVKPSEDSYVKAYNGKNLKLFQGTVHKDNPIGTMYLDKNQTYVRTLSPIYLPKGLHTYAYSNGNNSTMHYVTELDGSKTQSLGYGSINIASEEGGYVHLKYSTNDPNYPEPMEWIKIDDVYYMLKDVELISFDSDVINSMLYYSVYDYIDGEVDSRETSMILMDIKSLSMPSRYDDYNITIKNANISPKTHNTMLYPLLVNEDNPIEGKLDYTNYEGNNLSWSFAYTDEKHVDIMQPKNELLNRYEYRYNAFYDTEYEFDNPYEVARYTSSSRGVLPGFNAEFTYTYDEMDNGDGTYTTKVYADSLDNLPTKISFTANNNLLTVDKLNTSKVTTMLQMFRSCGNLTAINCRLDTSSVTNEITQLFLGCSKLEYVDATNLVGSNIKYASSLFSGCTLLKQIDGLNTWVTSNVSNMDSMFQNCSSLTSLDVSGFDTSNITNMANMFYGCSNLTSLDLSGFDTSQVTVMYTMFYNCSNLTSLDLSGFDTSNVTSMYGMFSGCSGLTSLDLSGFDTSNVTGMGSMFSGCSGLTSLDLSGFDTSQVTSMAGMFSGCSGLTSLDLSNLDTSEVTDMNIMFNNCRGLTSLNVSGFNTSKVTIMSGMFQVCTSLTSLNLSGFDTSKVTVMGNMFYNCTSLISLNVEGWISDNVNTIIPQLSVSPSTSTLYGTVPIDESTLPSGWVYEYNDLFVVAKYVVNASGARMTIYPTDYITQSVLDNGDGTYTVTATTSDLEQTPTNISTSSIRTSLVEIVKLNADKITAWGGEYETSGKFAKCTNLTNVNINWGDMSNVTSLGNLFMGCTKLEKVDMSYLDFSNVTSVKRMFYNCPKLKEVDFTGCKGNKISNIGEWFYNCPNLEQIKGLNSLGINAIKANSPNSCPSASDVFSNCSKLKTLDLSNWVLSYCYSAKNFFEGCTSLTEIVGLNTLNLCAEYWAEGGCSISKMFYGCSSLTNLDFTNNNWGWSYIGDISQMFYNCKGLTSLNVSGFNTSKVTNMSSMFYNCEGLTSLDVSVFDTTNVTNMSNMFRCKGLTSLDVSNFDTSKVTNMNSMFSLCSSLTSLDVSGFNTAEVTDMSGMFQVCSGLTSLDLSGFNTAKVTTMQSMFSNSSGLISLNLSSFDTTKVTDIHYMFYGCSSLTSLNLSSFDTTKVTSMFDMFYNCSSLIELDSMQNISTELKLSPTILDVTSLLDVINNLATVTTTKTLTLGSTLLAKLTEDQIAIATNKGWTVS